MIDLPLVEFVVGSSGEIFGNIDRGDSEFVLYDVLHVELPFVSTPQIEIPKGFIMTLDRLYSDDSMLHLHDPCFIFTWNYNKRIITAFALSSFASLMATDKIILLSGTFEDLLNFTQEVIRESQKAMIVSSQQVSKAQED